MNFMVNQMNKLQKNRKNKNKGFTLVELIIVIAIIAVLAAVLAPQYMKYVEKSKSSVDYSAITEVVNAAKVAAADPAYLNTAKSGKIFVVVNSTSGAVSITDGVSADNSTGIIAGISAVIGSDYVMKSTKGKALGTLVLDVDIATGSVAWDTASAAKVATLLAT